MKDSPKTTVLLVWATVLPPWEQPSDEGQDTEDDVHVEEPDWRLCDHRAFHGPLMTALERTKVELNCVRKELKDSCNEATALKKEMADMRRDQAQAMAKHERTKVELDCARTQLSIARDEATDLRTKLSNMRMELQFERHQLAATQKQIESCKGKRNREE